MYYNFGSWLDADMLEGWVNPIKCFHVVGCLFLSLYGAKFMVFCRLFFGGILTSRLINMLAHKCATNIKIVEILKVKRYLGSLGFVLCQAETFDVNL